jgi:hypothetical protein
LVPAPGFVIGNVVDDDGFPALADFIADCCRQSQFTTRLRPKSIPSSTLQAIQRSVVTRRLPRTAYR